MDPISVLKFQFNILLMNPLEKIKYVDSSKIIFNLMIFNQ